MAKASSMLSGRQKSYHRILGGQVVYPEGRTTTKVECPAKGPCTSHAEPQALVVK